MKCTCTQKLTMVSIMTLLAAMMKRMQNWRGTELLHFFDKNLPLACIDAEDELEVEE